jgi:hypothetical protein
VSSANRSSIVRREQLTLSAIDKYFGSVTQVTLLGTNYTPAALKALIQSDIDAVNLVGTTKAAWSSAVANARVTRATASSVLSALKSVLVQKYGPDDTAVFSDFGDAPPKTAKQPTPAVKAVAVDKRTATRAARHTLGKKEKAKIKGAVSPAIAPSATAATAPKA